MDLVGILVEKMENPFLEGLLVTRPLVAGSGLNAPLFFFPSSSSSSSCCWFDSIRWAVRNSTEHLNQASSSSGSSKSRKKGWWGKETYGRRNQKKKSTTPQQHKSTTVHTLLQMQKIWHIKKPPHDGRTHNAVL
mmetsp:Transcript_27323/g.29487  ORF Transcript_27323/g.29487 Transcript_27323/m.29487 type:complete len:134 (+) Transcript_27323:3343-3744(+)